MAVPAIPDAGKPWLTWAQGVDAEARKVADKVSVADIADPNSTGGAALRAAFGSTADLFRGVELWTYGHSYLAEVAGSVSATGDFYARRLATQLGMYYPTAADGTTVLKRAVGGSRVEEAASVVIGTNPWPNGRRGVVLVQSLLNTARAHGNDPAALATAKIALRALLATISAASRQEISSSNTALGLTESGTWSGVARGAASGGGYRSTTTLGSYAEITIPAHGGICHLLTFAHSAADGPIVNVENRTTGKQYGSVNLSARVISDFTRVSYAIPFDAAAGDRVRFTKADAGTAEFAMDALLVGDATPVPILAMKEPHLADYSLSTTFPNGSDAAIDAFNQLIDDLAAEYRNVIVADPNAGYWNKATDISSADGVHANSLGNEHLFTCARDALARAAPQRALGLRSSVSAPVEQWNAPYITSYDVTADPALITLFDADTPTAGAVASWATSGGSNTTPLVQATGTRQPIATAAVLNGHAALLFDGTDDNLATATWATAYSSPVTVFTVFQAKNGDGPVFGGLSTAKYIQLAMNTAGTSLVMQAGGSTATVAAALAIGNTWHIAAAVYDGASSRLYLDKKSSPTTGAVSTTTAAGLADLRLGVPSNNGVARLSGGVAYLAAVGRALTEPEISYALGQLATKYGLTVAA